MLHCGELFHQETCFPQALFAFQVFLVQSDVVSPFLADTAAAYLDLVTCVMETVDGVVDLLGLSVMNYCLQNCMPVDCLVVHFV